MSMTRNQIVESLNKSFDDVVEAVVKHTPKYNVYSGSREIVQPIFNVKGLKLNSRQKMDGLKLLEKLETNSIPLVFFDPQYRSILDKQNYGNEGEGRQKDRSELPQMTNPMIKNFLKEIERVLIPSGHLMLWVDKYILCSGIHILMESIGLQLVDMITWNKQRMGMGYRSRRYSEHLIVFQKLPVRAKGVWRVHDIPDVWTEKIENGDKNHTHAKPIELQKKLIKAVTNKGDIVVDPCAGGYSVMKSVLAMERHFIGCDILG
jgi:site-specific DNA-methyltransferase (adenine-specific)